MPTSQREFALANIIFPRQTTQTNEGKAQLDGIISRTGPR